MLQPAKTKYKKSFKGRIKGNSNNANTLSFGSYGLKSLGSIRVKANQIESARKVISRYVKRKGKCWIRIFPNIPVTKKPTDVRMGKGKGAVEFWVHRVNPGKILFEIEGIPKDKAYEALLQASAKLPLKTCIVCSDYGGIR